MIKTIVVKKIERAAFPPYRPVNIMIAFFDEIGVEQSTQLLPASLFDADIVEGQQVNFRKLSIQNIEIWPLEIKN